MNNAIIFVFVNQNEFKQYPPKPELKSDNGQLGSSIAKVGVFMVLFYFLSGGSIDTVLAILIILMIHELGHLTAMKIFKTKDDSIFFFPVFSRSIEPQAPLVSQKKRIITLLSGPLPGVVLGIILMSHAFSIGHEVLSIVGQAFIFVNLINLLPLDSMDGGKLTDAFFLLFKEQIKLVFLSLAALLFAWAAFYNLSMGVFAIFIGIRIYSMIRAQKLRVELVKNLSVDLSKTYQDISDQEYWEIRKYLLEQLPKAPINPDSFEPFVNENLLIRQVKAILKSPIQIDLGTGQKVILFALWLLGIVIPIWFVFSNIDQLIN
ncbi:MAG: hypothetical protein P8M05_03330 [Flavobacteriales bacterium]|nr:hypothetical protein [Flavobacteriales bacterium]